MFPQQAAILRLPDRIASIAAPVFMGIVNATPDSFSDGGQFVEPSAAIAHARCLIGEGADWIDVGGESTRPGATPVGEEEELRRTLPIIEALAEEAGCLISIDTSKPAVAARAIAAGASILNDVAGFCNPEMVRIAAESNAACIVMHMRGTPQTMAQLADYDDVVAELKRFFEERLDALERAGVSRDRILLDPGIGFAKKRRHGLEIIRRLGEIAALGRPILLGASRKSMLGELTERPASQRVHATIATTLAGYHFGARIFRVHDVAANRDALIVWRAIEAAGNELPSKGTSFKHA